MHYFFALFSKFFCPFFPCLRGFFNIGLLILGKVKKLLSERVTAIMKILIRENLQTKEINIYGADGKLHTEEFFEKYFSDTGGAYPTLPYEREEFQTDAEWTIITEADFLLLAETISVIQKAIDDVNEMLIGGEKVGEFVFQSECYLI